SCARHKPFAHHNSARPSACSRAAWPAVGAVPADLRARHSGRSRQIPHRAHLSRTSCERRAGSALRDRRLQRRESSLSAGATRRQLMQRATILPGLDWLRRGPIGPIASLAAFVALASPVHADDYYAGKTITFIVGTDTGGGFSIYARAIAKHLPRYIPGNPII